MCKGASKTEREVLSMNNVYPTTSVTFTVYLHFQMSGNQCERRTKDEFDASLFYFFKLHFKRCLFLSYCRSMQLQLLLSAAIFVF